MKIRYENVLEDFVAFNRYHQEHSPALRRSKRIGRWFFPAVFALIAIIPVLERGDLTGVIYVTPFAVLWLLIFPVLIRRTTDRRGVHRSSGAGTDRN